MDRAGRSDPRPRGGDRSAHDSRTSRSARLPDRRETGHHRSTSARGVGSARPRRSVPQGVRTPIEDRGHGMNPFERGDLPGRLFIVEGIDGSGKSTQLDLLHKWLVGEGFLVVFSEWNSSPIVKKTTKRGKNRRLLSPMSFSLIHSAAFARDAVRGVDREWLRGVYSFAPPPTLAFYFDVPLEEAIRRIMEGRPALKYYEAGLDMQLAEDPAESFSLYQGLIREEYERLVDEFDLVRMNATDNMIRLQQRMRELVEPHLDGVMRLEGQSLPDALLRAGLRGRYIGDRREILGISP